MSALRLVLALALVPLFASCTDAPPELDRLVISEHPIYGGFAPDSPHHFASVALVDRFGDTFAADAWCSGTLITPTVVVTAGHCLDIANGGKRFQTISPSAVGVYVGNDLDTDPGAYYEVVDTTIFPGYDRRQLFNDIALIRLKAPASANTVPVVGSLVSGDVGDTIEVTGFGRTEVGYTNELLHAEVTFGGFGCSVAGCYGTDDASTQFSYTQVSAGPCFGDSGGGAFVNRGGSWYLAGVTSWGSNSCDGFNAFGVSTRVDAYASWIAAFAGPTGPDCSANGTCNAECPVGDDPDCDTGPDCSADGTCNAECPVGDDPDCATGPDCSADGTCNAECPAGDDPDCDTGSVCGDQICDTGESCDGRSGTQSCSSDCPGKTNGKQSRRYCYVNGVCEGPGC